MQNAPDYIEVDQLIDWYQGDHTVLDNYREVECVVTYRIGADPFINDHGRSDLEVTATFISTKWSDLELTREMVVQIMGEARVQLLESEAVDSCYEQMEAA